MSSRSGVPPPDDLKRRCDYPGPIDIRSSRQPRPRHAAPSTRTSPDFPYPRSKEFSVIQTYFYYSRRIQFISRAESKFIVRIRSPPPAPRLLSASSLRYSALALFANDDFGNFGACPFHLAILLLRTEKYRSSFLHRMSF